MNSIFSALSSAPSFNDLRLMLIFARVRFRPPGLPEISGNWRLIIDDDIGNRGDDRRNPHFKSIVKVLVHMFTSLNDYDSNGIIIKHNKQTVAFIRQTQLRSGMCNKQRHSYYWFQWNTCWPFKPPMYCYQAADKRMLWIGGIIVANMWLSFLYHCSDNVLSPVLCQAIACV